VEELSKIVDWIPKGFRVLDLGCGEGSVLGLLVERKKAQVKVIEISPSGAEVCRSMHAGKRAYSPNVDYRVKETCKKDRT
jgi:cyclopropane fatty-acyl-phospholipid synthase-like methyltransferase